MNRADQIIDYDIFWESDTWQVLETPIRSEAHHYIDRTLLIMTENRFWGRGSAPALSNFVRISIEKNFKS